MDTSELAKAFGITETKEDQEFLACVAKVTSQEEVFEISLEVIRQLAIGLAGTAPDPLVGLNAVLSIKRGVDAMRTRFGELAGQEGNPNSAPAPQTVDIEDSPAHYA